MDLFFFFKQKTAYEMLRSLVGSEMCIRDRYMERMYTGEWGGTMCLTEPGAGSDVGSLKATARSCLLYTSDAADDLLCVDLGGRRLTKKKLTQHNTPASVTQDYTSA